MRIPVLTFLFSLSFIACQEVQDAQTFKHPDEITNPNGDSELAIVMRNIHFEANLVGRQLEKGEDVDLSKLEELAKRMSTSVPTDSAVLDNAYYTFASSLEEKVHNLESDEAVVEFNSLVKTCVACHKMTCPGPIKKIQKLKIKT